MAAAGAAIARAAGLGAEAPEAVAGGGSGAANGMHTEAFDGAPNHTQSTVRSPVLVYRESRILLTRLEGHQITYRPPNLQHELGQDIALHLATQRACFDVEHICIQAADVVAEENAVVIDFSLALRQKHARRPRVF